MPPSDRELQSRRQAAILEILAGEERVTEQQELVERLRERGIPATQSSISRDLRALGAVRAQGYYEIPSWAGKEEEPSAFHKVIPYIRGVRPSGHYQTYIATAPGTGRMVGQSITESAWEEILGVVEGDSSVLIVTESLVLQRRLLERLKHFLGAAGKREVIGKS